MNIRELRILPPLAIARVGSAPEPVVNYTIDDNPDQPLGFRPLVAQETLVVDKQTGEIACSFVPEEITFKDARTAHPPGGAVPRSVCAVRTTRKLVPLTLDLLRRGGGGSRSDFVECERRKPQGRPPHQRQQRHGRQPSPDGSLITSQSLLQGHCPNFISKAACIDFGQVRYVRAEPSDSQRSGSVSRRPRA